MPPDWEDDDWDDEDGDEGCCANASALARQKTANKLFITRLFITIPTLLPELFLELGTMLTTVDNDGVWGGILYGRKITVVIIEGMEICGLEAWGNCRKLLQRSIIGLTRARAAEDFAVVDYFAMEVDAFSTLGADDAIGLVAGEFFGKQLDFDPFRRE